MFAHTYAGPYYPFLFENMLQHLEQSSLENTRLHQSPLRERWIIVPGKTTQIYLARELLPQLSPPARSGLRILPLYHWLRILAQEKVRPESSLFYIEEVFILWFLIRSSSESFHVLEPSKITPESALHFFQAYRDLIEAGFTHDSEETHFEDMLNEFGGVWKGLLSDLLKMKAILEKWKKTSQKMDLHDLKQYILHHFASFQWPEEIHFFGFSTIQQLTYDLISEASTYTDVYLYIPAHAWQGKPFTLDPAFQHLQPFLETSYGHSRNFSLPEKETASGISIIPSTSSHKTSPSDESFQFSLRMICTHGIRGELDALLQEVLHALHSGIQAERIAVVLPPRSEYIFPFLEMLAVYELPFSLLFHLPGSYHPVGKWILLILNTCEEAFERQTLFEMLRHPLSRWHTELNSTKNRSAFDNFELFCEQRRVFRLSQIPRTLHHFTRTQSLAPSVTSFLENTFKHIASAYRDFRESKHLAQALESLLQLILMCTDTTRVLNIDWPGPPEISRSYSSAIWFQFQEICRKLIEEAQTFACQVGDKKDSQDIALRILKSVLHRMTIPPPAYRTGGILVTTLLNTRCLRAEYAMICGLNERVIPSLPEEDPLLPDALRYELRALFPFLSTKNEQYHEELTSFIHLIHSTRKGISIIYEQTTDSGEPAVPSPFLDHLRDQLCYSTSNVFNITRIDYPARPVKVSMHHLEQCGGAHAHPIDFIWWEPQKNTSPARLESFEFARKEIDSFLTNRGLSFSGFSTYITCPFQVFLAYLFDIPLFLPAETSTMIQWNEWGSFIHRFMEKIFDRKTLEKLLTLTEHERKLQLTLSARTLFSRWIRDQATDFRRFELWRLKRILGYVFQLVTEDIEKLTGEHVQIETEKPFETRLEFDETAHVKIRGILDRIEYHPDAIVIADYKVTGKPPRTKLMKIDTFFSHLESGKYSFEDSFILQLAFYALLFSRNTWQPSNKPLSSLIYWIPSRLMTEDWRRNRVLELNSAFLYEAMNGLETMIISAAKSISQGDFPVRPGDSCKSCAGQFLCRYQERTMHEMLA